MRKIKIDFFLLIVFFCFLFANCFSPIIIYTPEKPKKQIAILGDSFSLLWNKPDDLDPISYNIYYKQHKTKIWKYLGTTLSDTTEFKIDYINLDNGIYYDFGISAVYSTGESSIHSSLDNDAIPNPGWYIRWIIL